MSEDEQNETIKVKSQVVAAAVIPSDDEFEEEETL